MTNLYFQLRWFDQDDDNDSPGFDPFDTTEFEYETDDDPTLESRQQRERDGWAVCWVNHVNGSIRYVKEKQIGGALH